MRSLRSRAIVGGVAWFIVSLLIGGIALFSFIDSVTLRRFDQVLMSRHHQVVAALGNSGADPEVMAAYITDPGYTRPYSGIYWQISNKPQQQILTSRSLFDTVFSTPGTVAETPVFWTGLGPEGAVRGVRQAVSLEEGGEWVVMVAESVTALDDERSQIFQSLLAAFGLLGLLGIAGAVLQTSAALRPLGKLREDVAHRWDAGERLDPADYPNEVSPLVSDMNMLLERNREVISRARRQAADLAHALKTPSAILRNEFAALADRGENLTRSVEALDRIDAQIGRSLARIRTGSTDASAYQDASVPTSIKRLLRYFLGVPDYAAKTVSSNIPEELQVQMDSQDLQEVLGNLLENAFKWSATEVRITAAQKDNLFVVRIEDDGPGIAEDDYMRALRTGERLDTATPGTGLGLPIALDLIRAYGGALVLERSESLGGVCARFSVPSSGRGAI